MCIFCFFRGDWYCMIDDKERVLVLVKPDGMVRGLAGSIISIFDQHDLNMIECKLVKTEEMLIREHYKQLQDKPFFDELVQYLGGKFHQYNKILALIYQGENVIHTIRALAGATNPEEAKPKTLRGMYGRITTSGRFENVIHASSDTEEAEREIKLWFPNLSIL